MCADDVAHLLHLLFHCTIIENHVIGAVPAVNLRVISRSKAGAGPGREAEGLGTCWAASAVPWAFAED